MRLDKTARTVIGIALQLVCLSMLVSFESAVSPGPGVAIEEGILPAQQTGPPTFHGKRDGVSGMVVRPWGWHPPG